MQTRYLPRQLDIALTVKIAFLFVFTTMLVILAIPILPPGIDWEDAFRAGALAALQGKSPYTVELFVTPPWTVIPLIPFAILPVEIGRALLLLAGFTAFAYMATRITKQIPLIILFLVSPPVLHCLLNSNIEWLPLLGALMPPQIGLFFISMKPQVGIGIGLYWLYQAIKEKRVIKTFAPFTIMLLLSFLLYGFWPTRFFNTLELAETYNMSFFPYGIPLGLALLLKAIKKDDLQAAIASSPFMSPYTLLYTWTGLLLVSIKSKKIFISTVIILWIMSFCRILQNFSVVSLF